MSSITTAIIYLNKLKTQSSCPTYFIDSWDNCNNSSSLLQYTTIEAKLKAYQFDQKSTIQYGNSI